MANPVPLFPKPEQFWRVFGCLYEREEETRMSDWYDENGDSLGEWEVITEAEYRAIIDRPATDWWVFASNTDPWGRGEIYTAWGQDGEAAPRVDHRCIFEPPAPDHERLPKPTRCVYRKFRVLKEETERAATVVRNQEEETA